MGDDFWQPTAEMFSSLFEKPKMTEKLLTKPPFKYLFDIIIQTINSTGFGEGLYSAPELTAEFYDVKEKKMYFLQKVIGLVSIILKEDIEAKPNKIVAGVEPEKTNLLLQAMYRAAVSGISREDSDKYIKKLLQKFAKEEVEIVGREPQAEEPPKEKQKPPQEEPRSKPKEAAPSKDTKSKNLDEARSPVEKQKEPEKPVSTTKLERPSTASKRKDKSNVQVVETEKKNVGPANIIQDNADKDDDTNFIETQPQQASSKIANLGPGGAHNKIIESGMDAMKEVSKNDEQEENAPKGGGIRMKKLGHKAAGKPTGTSDRADASRGDAAPGSSLTSTGTSQNEVETIQKLIQSLTQNINPLKKSIDFINDDIESMNKEMDHWRSQYLGHKAKYQLELAATEEQLQPLQNKLAELEEQIKDRKFKIQAAKSQVLQNDQKIQKLLMSVVSNK